ncbi:hypothetical protein F0U44_19885 [Nocardioides humilatus]|uniref:Uncharacterized protein n=1 Tax=Nocardioides humilatus TaxID=2607660 RepID=A0A5B1L6U9_9ACTN|nr:hypothetical protein [Nocardioides humilatus]KAA1415898.1 hypothetical protein F0U44_19885 [Nocardioides humilatus]
MSAPLVLDRVVGRKARRQFLNVAMAIVSGVLLCGGALGAALTQDLDRTEQLQSFVLGAMGAVVAGWGFERVGGVRRLLLRGPVLRLDDHGVWIRTGSVLDQTAASVGWADVEAVELIAIDVPAPFTIGGGRPQEAVRFVLTDESAVEHDAFPVYTLLKAAALGLSPVAAALTFAIGPETKDRVPTIFAWLAERHPGLPVRELRD